MTRVRALILGFTLASLFAAAAPAKPLGPAADQRTESKRGVTTARHESKTAQGPKKTLPPKRSKVHASKHDKAVFKRVSLPSPLQIVLDDLGIC